ncbi:MarR family winged helix-turn-helix transcriptional regulator [Mesoplasma lactucae]|uniref:Uncharacterized protein n=1 Tax=Mesoplasma lactucae ATCC 49193 TaxID=81460 RepID=A0A291ISJ4_9MOLU|nr:MarR family transcriptional regulator [Mesoplasma lactucae]ATG97714.1 hypothetical protein CP520_03180 [Mesoplasma lactucae ATCC 49193]ATZ20511.1 hypothetical protein MLACT_v1c06900 [Mesoplasma lactucae ATCC 49193]MCL8216682.1 hypothetical protein [Mesoplasma lactucae ATCC 49193]
MDDKNFSVVTNYALNSYNLIKKIQKSINNKYKIGGDNLFYILVVVANEGLNQEKIGETLWVNKSKVARTLNTLEEEGFVERRQDKKNRRQNNIFSTPKGKKVYEDTIKLFNQIIPSEDEDKLKQILASLSKAN